MEGDFRRPPRRMDGFSGGRPQPQPSHRPDRPAQPFDTPSHPRPTPPSPTYHHPHHQPRPIPIQNEPAHHAPIQHTSVPRPPAPEPQFEPRPTTAELIAQHEQASRKDPGNRRSLVLAVAGLVIIAAVALLFVHRSPAKHTGPFPASISAAQITIPVYYPKDLPKGFKVTGSKVVKQDNLNYDVISPNNDSFYVNIQAIPANYDFAAFNKRFSSPTTYQTTIGTATMGLINNELVCSLQTAKSWVLINSTATKSSADMATVAKALKPASL